MCTQSAIMELCYISKAGHYWKDKEMTPYFWGFHKM
jgi:hypothetical protein